MTSGSIAVNASGNALNPTVAGLFVDPVRGTTGPANTQYPLAYNSTSKEVYKNTGDVVIGGNATISGDTTISGNATISGTVLTVGNSTIQNITANEISTSGNVGSYTITLSNILNGLLWNAHTSNNYIYYMPTAATLYNNGNGLKLNTYYSLTICRAGNSAHIITGSQDASPATASSVVIKGDNGAGFASKASYGGGNPIIAKIVLTSTTAGIVYA
jgi:hypothetical protein